MAILWLHPPGCCRHTTTLPNTSRRAFTTCCLLLADTNSCSFGRRAVRQQGRGSIEQNTIKQSDQQSDKSPTATLSLTTGTNQNGFDGNHIISSPAHANMCKKMFWHGMYFLTGKNSSWSNERFFFPIAALSIFQALQACRRNCVTNNLRWQITLQVFSFLHFHNLHFHQPRIQMSATQDSSLLAPRLAVIKFNKTFIRRRPEKSGRKHVIKRLVFNFLQLVSSIEFVLPTLRLQDTSYDVSRHKSFCRRSCNACSQSLTGVTES